MFGSAELFGQFSTVRYLFLDYINAFHISALLTDPHVHVIIVGF